MKAILINSLQHGGAERIALNIFQSLSSQAEDIFLIVLKKSEIQYQVDSPNVIYLSSKSDLNRGLSLRKILAYPTLLFKLRSIIKKNNIDVVQSHLFTASIINVLSRILGGKQQVQIVNHMLVSYEKSAGIVGKLKIASLRFTYKKADKLISISQKMKMDIAKLILKGKTIEHIVIPNPHDIDSIILESKKNPEIFHFNQNIKYIVSAGRLVKRKKIDNLIKAFSEVSKEITDCELLILGNGEEEESLKALSNSLKITQKVHFLGFTSNPFCYISNADIFVLASESEGLPNAVIEAMVCNTPVISTDCPTGPREILSPDTNINSQLENKNEEAMYGLLTPINNVYCLKEAIKSVFTNYDIYKKKAENALQYCQKFEYHKVMEIYKSVLQ